MRFVPARFPFVLVAALLISLAAAPAASAFSITAVDVRPQVPGGGSLPPGNDPLAAGAHPDLVTTVEFSDRGNARADSVRDLALHYAPGIVAYVNHVPQCSLADFAVDAHGPTDAARCSAATRVGASDADTTADILGTGLNLPLRVSGSIYNLEAPAGAPAALGVDIPVGVGMVAIEHLKFIIPIGVDPNDLGLNASLSGLPNVVGDGSLVPNVHSDRLMMTLFGYVAGRSFFTNPTACIPAAISITATSHANAVATGSDAYTPTDCENVPFGTTLAIVVDPPLTDWTSTVTSNVRPAEFDVPRANSHVRSTTVTLPQSLLLNPALAARLDACSDAQFALRDTSVEARCPPSSAVGDIDFVSPILGSFPGRAFFGESAPGDRLRLFLDVPLFGAHIKVSAHVRPSTTTGQITTIFDELPQIAFTDFRLTFHGGPRSALVSPTECGTHTASAITTPWSGTAPQTSSGSFTVSWDGRGAPCPRLFQPSMETAVSNARGGATGGRFTLIAQRPDRHVPVGRMTYDLPAGLVGSLALRGLTKCSLADAAVARCPASSRLGPVDSLAGSGTEPPALPGDVFLTEPKVKGDPAGLSVAVPARLGPVDAGIVIVGARLQLRPDGGLHVVSDPIPPLQEGIPLAIRKLTVTIDRSGFMRNPTSCGEQQALGFFNSIGSETASIRSSLAFTGCDRLRFRPRLRAFIGARGKTKFKGHPPFTTVISTRGSDAAIASARVRLPRALATNLRGIGAACSPEDFAASRCSRRAQTATAEAISPLFPTKVTGPVWLVRRERGQLPKLVVQLRNPIALTFEGFNQVGSRGLITTTFPLLPDLALTKFTLRFRGGRYSALENTTNLCRSRLRMPLQFRGHNGKAVSGRPRIAVRGCRTANRRRK
jgi:hypothetical protein